METIRLRRRYPASLAAALALLITMLVVYLLSVHALPKQDAAAMAQGQSSASLRLEGLECDFLLSGLHDDLTQARVAAARCSLDGGTGLVLPEGDRYAVVQEAGGDYASAEAPVIHRSAPGLTLEIEAVAPVIEAVSDGCGALRALATETGALAAAMDRGELDGRTLDALLNVYRTQLTSARAALATAGDSAAILICGTADRSLTRMEGTVDAAKIRLIHAAACAEWISLMNNLTQMGVT